MIKYFFNFFYRSANEELSIVNINVSILFSEETFNNSKNSLTFNYSPDSTSKMNMTKDFYNSAKKTIRTNTFTNKSNSINNNNLLTENSVVNSNYNTINIANGSKEDNNNSGNPYLLEKITSLLNKNRPQNNTSNSNNNSHKKNNDINNFYNDSNNYVNNEREINKTEVKNNFNIENYNYINFT